MQILEKLGQKFVPANHFFSTMEDQNIEKTAVVEIVVESISGKVNVLSQSHTVLLGHFHVQK